VACRCGRRTSRGPPRATCPKPPCRPRTDTTICPRPRRKRGRIREGFLPRSARQAANRISLARSEGDVYGDRFAVTLVWKFTEPPGNLPQSHPGGEAERHHCVVKDKPQTTLSDMVDLNGLHETLHDLVSSRTAKSKRRPSSDDGCAWTNILPRVSTPTPAARAVRLVLPDAAGQNTGRWCRDDRLGNYPLAVRRAGCIDATSNAACRPGHRSDATNVVLSSFRACSWRSPVSYGRD